MALVRIAVLECDTPIPRVRAKYGVYSDIFRNLLQTAANNLHPAPKLSFTAYDVVNGTEYPELEIVDAILLSGSKYNSYDDDEWILALIDFVKKSTYTKAGTPYRCLFRTSDNKSCIGK